MSMDLSSRHLPDISDAFVSGDFSNTSFQIPANMNETQDLLLADHSFFRGLNDALTTPGARLPLPRFQAPLTLEELTPRSRRTRASPVRSSVRTRPNIPSPLKHQVIRDLSMALEDALSPLKPHDTTFTMPSSSADGNLLAAEDSGFFRSGDTDITFTDLPESDAGAQERLTLSQLTPRSSRIRYSSSASPVSPTPGAESCKFSTETIVPLGPSSPEDGTILSEEAAVPACEHDGASAEVTSVANRSSPHTLSLPAPLIVSPSSDEDPQENVVAYAAIVASGSCSAESGNMFDDFDAARLLLRETGNRAKAQGKAKRTVIEGGITKRPKPKLPVSRPARDIPKPERKTRSHSTAANRSLMAVHSATEKRNPSTSHPDPSSGRQVPTVHDNDILPGGLAAALMSYGKRSTSQLSDRSAVRQEKTESVTEPSPAVPESDVQRKQHDAERAQPSSEALPADADREIDQQRSSAGISQSTAPDYTNDLSSRQAQPTVGEISFSPAKANRRDPAYSAVPPSPMRPSTKRRSSPGPGNEQPRKKGKDGSDSDVFTMAPRPAPAQSKPSSSQHPKTLQTSRSKPDMSSRAVSATNSARGITNAFGSGTGPTSARPRLARSAKAKGAVTKPDARLNARPRHLAVSGSSRSIHDQNLLDARTTLASSSSIAASKPGDDLGDDVPSGRESRRLPHSSQNPCASGSVFTRPGRKPLIDKVTHLRAKPEKPPFEFTFSLDTTRGEAGKAEGLAHSKGLDEFKRSLKAHGLLPIPDYKRMHTAQEERLATLRGQIVPVVPVPLELHTDVRAHEREQFDEGLRSRHKEAERRAEERRRAMELEEEKEIRELRRRAVPKANEVPDWYQHAPKRGRKDSDEEGTGSVCK